MTTEESPVSSTFELIGGAVRLRELVDRFYDLMELELEFAGIRKLHPNSLDDTRDKLYWFLSGWMGGPDLYVERIGHPRLRARHLPYPIASDERDQWLRCMAWAMQDVEVADPLQLRLMESFYKTADWMRNKAECPVHG
ncbi:MAG: group II truncated hemoglobin [Burkholderiaceae bacterium]